jgi:3',5'-cyclic-AMP phosphodiesterase
LRPHATVFLAALLVIWGLAAQPSDSFRFAIIGDRTGEHVAGVYEEVWKEAAADKPAFAVSVGDTIEGLNDATAEIQWREIEQFLSKWKSFPLYLVPGNHDIWSAGSEQLFTKNAGHQPHYSFDYGPAHFTVLDNSRADDMPPSELAFLDADLTEHDKQPLKFIVSHRPSWIIKTMLDDPDFELHRIAKKHGARWVIAGHIHELLHADVDGVTYVSMQSAGGHLRGAGKYENGWFFGYTIVDVKGSDVEFHVHELNEPFGKGRTTSLDDWGKAGIRQNSGR